jgi:hypothetical protein
LSQPKTFSTVSFQYQYIREICVFSKLFWLPDKLRFPCQQPYQTSLIHCFRNSERYTIALSGNGSNSLILGFNHSNHCRKFSRSYPIHHQIGMDNLKSMIWPPINRMFSWNDNLYILGDKNAALSRDFELAKEHNVTVSPTLIFNEGRQRLNGNVGYRVIEANIRELLHNPPDEQSWC